MVQTHSDTIAAIATPPGSGGLAVIRISGPDSWKWVQSLFKGNASLVEPQSHHLYHGWIMNGEEPVDEVILARYKAPHSYTGEEVIEISSHGGSLISRQILQLILKQGVRIAKPGEFTQRAFLNGKMDLNQAEAVADLIQAQTEAARRVAVYQLEGRLSARIEDLRKSMMEICSLLELELDFGDEDVTLAPGDSITRQLLRIDETLTELSSTFQRGRICREGIRLVIAGRPNVGKSSLLNRLIEKDRAIVTDIPGTTRDTIEEILDIDGILFSVTDTAGLQESRDRVELEGMARTQTAIDRADIIIWMIDAGERCRPEDDLFLIAFRQKGIPIIIAVNKIDLNPEFRTTDLNKTRRELAVLKISALTGRGVAALKKKLRHQALYGDMPCEGEVLITQVRHLEAILAASGHIHNAVESLKEGLSYEFAAMDIRGALDALGLITGHTTTEDILNHIFSKFCIGK